MSALHDRVGAALADVFERPVRVTGAQPVGGGDINETSRIETDVGPFFLKENDGDGAWFSVEAYQLRALREVCAHLRVPEPIAWVDPEPGTAGFLVLEHIDRGRPGPDYSARLAEGLAELHAAHDDAFGFGVDTYCGTTLQPNARRSSWVEFYRDARLLHQVKLVVDRGRLSAASARPFERLAYRLDDLLEASARPSLIHGDLWSGNHFADGEGRPVIFDPAAYYAHPEAELGMMTLFGGFSPELYERYAEASGLERAWRERNPLYQLYHVLNHATLFGGSYPDQALQITRRFVG